MIRSLADGYLLFIEPTDPATAPVEDEVTERVRYALVVGERGTANYSRGPASSFTPGGGYRGFHVCACGEIGGNQEVRVPTGEVTNFLALHYVQCHRSEVPQEQIDRILSWPAPTTGDEPKEVT